MPFHLHRRLPATLPARGTLYAGAALVDITPPLGVGLAGFGPTSNAAQGLFGRLHASLLLLEDPRGTRALLGTLDLFAGSRYLHEALGIALADIGLSTDRILLAASHTHRGPSALLGSTTFDRIAGPAWVHDHWDAPFDQPLADVIVNRLADAVRALVGPPTRTPTLVTLRPAELALAGPTLWGWVIHRSASALDGTFTVNDPDRALWNDPAPLSTAEKRTLGERFTGSAPPSWLGSVASPLGVPLFERGALEPTTEPAPRPRRPTGPPSTPSSPTLDALLRDLLRRGSLRGLGALLPCDDGPRRPMHRGPDDRLPVDARLHLLIAREPDGPPIGAFGIFGATPSLVAATHAIATPDAFGVAVQLARARLRHPVPMGIGGGTLGDTNVLPRDLPFSEVRRAGKHLEDAASLVQRCADAFAHALVDALEHAPLSFRDDILIEPRFVETRPQDLGLDPHGRQGRTALGGSELAGSPLAFFYEEGSRSAPTPTPNLQDPKAVLPPFEEPGTRWALRELRFTRDGRPWWTLLGLPHECSTALGHALRATVGRGDAPVTVASPCGGFAGYADTLRGYTAQAYEGSMNFHGRYTGDALLALFARGLPAGTPTDPAVFSSEPGALPLRLGRSAPKPNLLAASVKLKAGPFASSGHHRHPRLQVQRDGGRTVLFAVVEGIRPRGPVHAGPLVAVGTVEPDRSRATLLQVGTLPLDDRNWPFLIWADVQRRKTIWRIRVQLEQDPMRPGLLLYPGITGSGPVWLDEDGFLPR